MTFNIANFSAHVNRFGTVQTNKFRVEIGTPAILSRINNNELYQYRASSVKIPGVNFDMQNVARYGVGPLQKFPTNVSFTDIDVTFLDTNYNSLWKYFTIWMNGIFDYTGVAGGSQASYAVEYKSNYVADTNIYVHSNSGDLVNKITLKEAFPVSLGDVNLSWSQNNRLYEFTVRFSFREWFFEGYQTTSFESGAVLGPSASSQVLPQPTESPRPQQSTREVPTTQLNPGGLAPGAQTIRRQNFGVRGNLGGFPPAE
jgi:hypothetical protein